MTEIVSENHEINRRVYPVMEFSKKRRQLTLNEKLNFLQRIESGKKLTAVAKEFGISNSTASGIFKEKSKIMLLHEHYKLAPHRKRIRMSLYYDVDEAVYMWFRQMRAKNTPVNGPMLQQKARDFAVLLGHKNFEGSSGWLSRFRERHDMSVEAMRGDIGESDVTSIGMTDEEIITTIKHNTSALSESEYIVSNLDISDIIHNDSGSTGNDGINDSSREEDNKSNMMCFLRNSVSRKKIQNDTCFKNEPMTNISNGLSSSHSNQYLDCNDDHSSNNKWDNLNFCDSTFNVADTHKQSENHTSPITLSEAVSNLKNLSCFLQQQSDIPKHVWDSFNTINGFVLGDLTEKLKQKKITDYFK